MKSFQIQEENQFDTLYAPVARITTIRIMLGNAAQNNWEIE